MSGHADGLLHKLQSVCGEGEGHYGKFLNVKVLGWKSIASDKQYQITLKTKQLILVSTVCVRQGVSLLITGFMSFGLLEHWIELFNLTHFLVLVILVDFQIENPKTQY